MNQDFVDLLRAFSDHKVRFLIVGAYALGVHGRPRATGDLDVGVVAARVASSGLEGLLYGITPSDPLTLGAVVVTMLVVSTLASYAPARRILRESPARTLRDI